MASLQTLSAASYHAIDAVSASRLKALDRSPAHLKWLLEHPEEETQAQKLGTATHTAILEPERFKKEYAVGPVANLSTKIGKAAWAEFEEAHPGKVHLRAHEGEVVAAIQAGVERTAAARMILRNPGPTEVSLTWNDRETLLPCRARADKRYESQSGVVLVDLKTVPTASPDKLRYKIVSDGWHLQAAHYLAGFNALGRDHRMVFICFEKTPPYACCVIELTENALAVAESERMRLLHLYKRCVERDEWPDYSDRIYSVDLPPSFYARTDTEPLREEQEEDEPW
jgi:hypothetical protein